MNTSEILKYLAKHPDQKVKEIALELDISEDEVREIRKQLREKQAFLEFVKVWNDARHYPANYDLMRALGVKSIGAIQAKARRYRAYSLKYHDAGLPSLIWRKVVTGGIIPVPEEVLLQREPFRFDMERLKEGPQGKPWGVVVTSAQLGAHLNKWHWASLLNYEKARGFPVMAMALQYGPTKLKDGVLTSTFPEELKGRIIFDDVLLCKGELMLNAMRLRPTLDRFLTDQICAVGGVVSQVFAAPKLELEHRPRIGHRYPKAIMTTGAVTIPNYRIDNLGQQDRTGELATAAHQYAAIVIEFDGQMFHFRQLLANKKGEFYDINPKKGGADFFTPQGVTHVPDGVDTIFCGDWHVGKTDPDVRKGTFGKKKSMVKLLKPKNVVVQDFVDCDSVSKWEEGQGVRRAFKAPLQWDSLEDELNAAVEELNWMRNHTDAEIYVIASNHPEYVQDYVEKLKWAHDNRNLAIGNRLFGMMLEDMQTRAPFEKAEARSVDPVTLWFRKYCPEVTTLERQDVLLLPKKAKHQVLCSMHGDLGVRGRETRGTQEFRKMNQWIFLGHNHSAVIYGPVWRVGTATPRMQFYVKNPSTDWTNTHGLIFKNGQRQLVHFINGHWHARWWSGKQKK